MSKSYRIIENFDTAGAWTILGDATENKAASAARITGAYSLEFDKKNGTNLLDAGASKTFSGGDIPIFQDMTPMDYMVAEFYVQTLTDVAYAFVRMGTSASAYVEWKFLDTGMVVGWNQMAVKIGTCNQYNTTTGSWTPFPIKLTDPTYLAVGVYFDAEDKTLADIKFDHIAVVKAERTVT